MGSFFRGVSKVFKAVGRAVKSVIDFVDDVILDPIQEYILDPLQEHVFQPIAHAVFKPLQKIIFEPLGIEKVGYNPASSFNTVIIAPVILSSSASEMMNGGAA